MTNEKTTETILSYFNFKYNAVVIFEEFRAFLCNSAINWSNVCRRKLSDARTRVNRGKTPRNVSLSAT